MEGRLYVQISLKSVVKSWTGVIYCSWGCRSVGAELTQDIDIADFAASLGIVLGLMFNLKTFPGSTTPTASLNPNTDMDICTIK